MQQTERMNKAMKTIRLVIFTSFSVLAVVLSSVAYTAEPIQLPRQDWHFSGPLGTFDRASLQRGYMIYRRVCAACHSMKYVAFRNLEDIGYSEAQIKAIAAEYTYTDGPDDEGKMYERPGLPSDRFKSPYPNHNAARAANNGALPPDLSLIIKARHRGPDHVYGILTGYEEAPEGVTLRAGQFWNRYMPGHIIAMVPPLAEDMITYEDGTPQTVEQYARDVVTFLAWAAEPMLEDRKRAGMKVLIFLLIFTGIMYAIKERIWTAVR